jgi:hypothetical protein
MVFVVGVYIFYPGSVVAHGGQGAEQVFAGRKNFEFSFIIDDSWLQVAVNILPSGDTSVFGATDIDS